MGIFSTGCETYIHTRPVEPPTPEYIVKKRVYLNGYSILKVWYLGVQNCGGEKVLVLEGEIDDLTDFDPDPHFQEEGGPIARFHPSQMGWSHALLFVENL